MTCGAGRGGPFGRAGTVAGAATHALLAPVAAESSPPGTAGRSWAARAWGVLLLAAALAGVASVGNGTYLYAKASVGQWLLGRAWDETRASGRPARPWPWADTYPIARLIVPAADANVLLLAGASGRTLAWGPGHLDGSAPLGAPGNAVVSAHRDTHFRFLRNVAVGDAMLLELKDGAHRHYRVRERYIADVRALRLSRMTPSPTLTLVTCYPFDAIAPGGPLRLVVVAEAG